ncbi:hypothetical protein TNCV_423611 [Trichonephila clavipes]|nr:hypothetical protein TNCV_423611 [Trichonephila clavipes]
MQKFVCNDVEKEDFGHMKIERREIWSDESRYILFCSDVRRLICQEPHEVMNESCPTRRVQGSGGSTIIWGTICWHGRGALMFREDK